MGSNPRPQGHGWRWHVTRIARLRTTDPVLRTAEFTRQFVGAAATREKLGVTFAQQAIRQRKARVQACHGVIQDTNMAPSWGARFQSLDLGISNNSLDRTFGCAIRSDGALRCWGHANTNPAIWDSLPTTQLKSVTAAAYGVCVLTAQDEVYCDGLDSVFAQDSPNLFSAISASNIGIGGTITAAKDYACGIRKTDQRITCWGNTTHLTQNFGLSTYKALSADSQTVCALRAQDGVPVCRGTGSGGVLTPPISIRDAKTIAVSGDTACVIQADDTLTCWGSDTYGVVSEAPSGTFHAITSAPFHMCALRSDNQTICWGDDLQGRTNSPNGLFSAVSAATQTSCAVNEEGFIQCWGAPFPTPPAP